MRWLPLLLALALAGCSRPAVEASPSGDDVCSRAWDALVDERERHQFADRVRLVNLVTDVQGEHRLADVRYDITWGHDPGDGRTLTGTLDDLVGRPPPWTYEDATAPGLLSDGDRLVLEAPGASSRDLHAMVTLEHADGRFLGGTARCL